MKDWNGKTIRFGKGGVGEGENFSGKWLLQVADQAKHATWRASIGVRRALGGVVVYISNSTSRYYILTAEHFIGNPDPSNQFTHHTYLADEK